MLTITGGKLTTWRRMAKQVVDRMVEREGRDGALPHRRHPARDGGRRARARPARRPRARRPARRAIASCSASATATRRATCCGSPASGPSSPRRSSTGQPDLLAEAAIAARLEQARTVADVLLRRTRLGLLAAPQLRDAESVAPVAEAMGGELGWDAERVARRGRALGRRRRRRGDRSGGDASRRRLPDEPMRLFIDTGSVAEVEEIAAWGVLAGRDHQPVAARQGGRRPGRHRAADLRPGRRAGLGRGRLQDPARDDRRGPGAARAARARHGQGALLTRRASRRPTRSPPTGSRST